MIFLFKSSVRPLKDVEVKRCSRLNLGILTSVFLSHSEKTDFNLENVRQIAVMSNGSKALIYLTLLFFLSLYLQIALQEPLNEKIA